LHAGYVFVWRQDHENERLCGVTLALSASAVQPQELKKGNVVGMHVSTIKLAAGVTMEKFTAFFVEKAIPAYEKSWLGWKFYPVRRIRGEKAEGFGLVIVIPTEAEREVLQRGRQPLGTRQGGECEGPADRGRDEHARHDHG
jgi:hypothetical protein